MWFNPSGAMCPSSAPSTALVQIEHTKFILVVDAVSGTGAALLFVRAAMRRVGYYRLE